MRKPIPIVLVHGNGDNASVWNPMINRFKKLGYEQIFAISMIPPQNESNIFYSDQLKSFIDNVLNLTKASEIDLIAHSLGCTVSRYYLKFLKGSSIVNHAVLICSANHGIPSADRAVGCSGFKQAHELITTGSAFLESLNTNNFENANAENADIETYGTTKYMTISSPHDEFFIFHSESPQLIGADNRVIFHKGHYELRDCDESFVCVRAFLEDTAETVSVGKNTLPTRNDSPIGSWHIIGGENKGQSYSFLSDGKFEYKASESDKISTGIYFIENQADQRINSVKLIQPQNETKLGFFESDVTNSYFKIILQDQSDQPDQKVTYNEIRQKFASAPIFEKVYKFDPIPKNMVGLWKAIEYGFLNTLGWLSVYLEIQPEDSRDNKLISPFKLFGKNRFGSKENVEISGNLNLSYEPAISHINFDVRTISEEIMIFPKNDSWPGLFDLKYDRLQIRWGSFMFGIPRPFNFYQAAIFQQT